MNRYLATINVPGYLPMDDDPPTFDTPQEAWAYLAEERKRAEDDVDYPSESPLAYEYSEGWGALSNWGEEGWDYVANGSVADYGLAPDGTGSIALDTPGREGEEHDLGLVYSVTVVEPEVQEGRVPVQRPEPYGGPDKPMSDESAELLRRFAREHQQGHQIILTSLDPDFVPEPYNPPPTEAKRLWVAMTDEWWEPHPEEPGSFWRTVEPCDDTCHHPVHAFNPERLRHLESAVWVIAHGVREKPVVD